MKKYWKQFALILALIFVCSIASRLINSGETLSEYAQKNPEKAYGTTNESMNDSSNGLASHSSSSASDASSASTLSDASSGLSASSKSGSSQTDQATSNHSSKDDSSRVISSSKSSSQGNSSDTLSSENSSSKKTLSKNSTSKKKSSNSSSSQSSAAVSSNTDSALSAMEKAMKKRSIPSDSDAAASRTTYRDGFYYQAISSSVFQRIYGISYPADCPIEISDLRYCILQYIDFNGNTQSGEMICNKSIADDVMEIFAALYDSGYQIQSIQLIDNYGGDDTASMTANNTSCFNYRVVDGTTHLSKHAMGLAIDLNPFYNPYIKYNSDGSLYISPAGSEGYADRTQQFAYKIDENDLAYSLFLSHGFIWGGNWNSVKDYQHFQKS